MLRNSAWLLIALAAAGCATAPSGQSKGGQSNGGQSGEASSVAASTGPVKQVDLAPKLDGATAQGVATLLGEPEFIRREGVREFRRYAYEDCVVFVMMEPDETGALIADHVELLSANTDDASAYVKDCSAPAAE